MPDSLPTVMPDLLALDLADQVAELARRWVDEAAEADPDPAPARLAAVLRDDHGLPFTIGAVDGVMRPESLGAAASSLSRVAPLVPGFLPWYLRGAVRAGGVAAPVVPMPVVPLARRLLRELVGHLTVDARPKKLAPALAKLRESGTRLDLTLLGGAVLGDAEAQRRADGVHELIRRDDVDRVTVPVSAMVGRISPWAFDDNVERAVERLRPLYLTAAENGTHITLASEQYRDLALAIAVFTRLRGETELRELEAGIELPTYLPDALPALEELTAWARVHVAEGGAPIRVRLAKSADPAMERVDAVLHDWPPAPHGTKADADAEYLRCLEFALRPEHTGAVRVAVAGHTLFDLAHAWQLATQRDVRDAIDVELPLGTPQGHVQAIAREVGSVLLSVPVVEPGELDVATAHLVRRLEESGSPASVPAAVALADDPVLFEREHDRFVAAVDRAADPALPTGPNRHQDRAGEHDVADAAAPAILKPAGAGAGAGAGEDDLTAAVLGIARGSQTDTAPLSPEGSPVNFGGEPFVETAVYSMRESDAHASGAPGFRNTADSDPALPAHRAWAREVVARIPSSTAGVQTAVAARIEDADALEDVVARTRRAAESWGALPASERVAVLQRAARGLEARRGELIEVAASETGTVFAEADAEVSEAVDVAAYYAATARELDRVSGAVFSPSRVTVVTSPSSRPLAIPAGGVLAALAAGSGVVLTPEPRARRSAAVVAEVVWEALRGAGVSPDVLALADLDDGELGSLLAAHADVDRVLLAGSRETAELWRSRRSDLPLLAETGGKNAMIVMPSADLDLAADDLVRSAFGRAGQDCAAASIAILVGQVGRSRRFARQLVDATRSLRVGPPTDLRSDVGPVIEQPHGRLAWALSTLDEGEQWLVEPRLLDSAPDYAGRLWTPGIRTGVQPGSRFHLEEFAGPVLGIMHATSLSQAIELQNAVSSGLTAGLQTRHSADLAMWIDDVEAGNLYVNRGITGAVVQRQPFGGWKRSSVGTGMKSGGPNHLLGLGSWRATAASGSSSTLHLRGLDTRITDLIEAAQPSLDYASFEWLRRGALADALAWNREYGQVKDVSHLGVERNLFRYRPVPRITLRATADVSRRALLRVVVAGIRSGADFDLSLPEGLPAAVRHVLGDQGIAVWVETDQEWLERVRTERPARVRLIGPREPVAASREALAVAVEGNPGVAVYDDEVTTAGRIELLPFLREQSITITAHRFGTPDGWSEPVI